MSKKAFSSLLWVFVVSVVSFSVAQEKECDLEYENHNQTDYGPLVVQRVTGHAVDPDGVPVPSVCLGLFTEQDHRLVASSVTDEEGRFRFQTVSPGRYRLVAKYAGFCTANVPLWVKNRSLEESPNSKQLVLQMRLPEIDTCSFDEYK